MTVKIYWDGKERKFDEVNNPWQLLVSVIDRVEVLEQEVVELKDGK